MLLVPTPLLKRRLGPITLAYLTGASDTANKSEGQTYSFASQSFGAAAPSRVIICACHLSGDFITAVTIGGVAATKVVETVFNGNSATIWAAAVPTGTTGTVVATVGVGGSARCRINLFRMLDGNLTATATRSNFDSSGFTTETIPIPVGGAGLVAVSNNVGSTNIAWSGATSVDETAVEGAGLRASAALITASGTVTANGAITTQVLAMAAFGP